MSALLKTDFNSATGITASRAPVTTVRHAARRGTAYALPPVQLVPTVSDQLAAREAGDHAVSAALRDMMIRVLDIAGALTGLIITAPLLLITALLITRDGGPAVFNQIRVGRNGQGFRCFKLRSMAADAEARLEAVLASNPQAAAEWAQSRKLKDDPRITKLGHFIRKTSIDELPQLWNVLKGDMSLVGPRPIVPDELAMYGKDAEGYLANRPGLTGLWQVSGRSDCDYATRIALDIEWTRTRSVVSYLEIVLKTVPAVLAKDGAY